MKSNRGLAREFSRLCKRVRVGGNRPFNVPFTEPELEPASVSFSPFPICFRILIMKKNKNKIINALNVQK